MRRRKENGVLTVMSMFGEAVALAVVLAVLVMFVWMSLNGSYEVLIRTNSYGEHYAELTLLCIITILVTVDLIRRFARLRKGVVRGYGE